MTSIPCELLLDIYHALPRHEIEKSKLVCYSWNHLILNNLSLLPYHLLQTIKIVPRSLSSQEGAIIYSEHLQRHVSVLALRYDEIQNMQEDDKNLLVMKSLKYGVFEQFLDKTGSCEGYEAVQRAEILWRVSGEKLKVIEFLAFGLLTDTVFILENYVFASRAIVDTPIEQVLGISTQPRLWSPPAEIELSFSISLYSDHFLSLLRMLNLDGRHKYRLNVRLNRHINKGEFFEKILEVYETCENPESKIKHIRFCNLALMDLSDEFILRRGCVQHETFRDRLLTVDTYRLELAHDKKLKIEFIQKELDRGWVEYECIYNVE